MATDQQPKSQAHQFGQAIAALADVVDETPDKVFDAISEAILFRSDLALENYGIIYDEVKSASEFRRAMGCKTLGVHTSMVRIIRALAIIEAIIKKHAPKSSKEAENQ